MAVSSFIPSLTKFPNISRFIPEYSPDQQKYFLKIFSVTFISGFLLMAIMLKGITLFTTIGELQAADKQKQTLAWQQVYWEKVAQEHPGYRDAYFQLATLSYRLGEKVKATEYLDQAMKLDPNFAEGKDFQAKLQAK